MIDLNSLALYKNKISSYVDQNVLGISTKSNILSLFNFRNYTGNGLTIPSSVKINEGVASNFSKNTFITTSTELTSLNDDFEIQVKFNYFQKRKVQSYADTLLGSNTLDDRLILVIEPTSPYNFLVFDFSCGAGTNANYAFNYRFGIKYNFDENLGDYYIKIIKENNNYTLKLYDGNFTELLSETRQTDKRFKAANLTLGAQVENSNNYYARNLTIDLNETFIKQNGQIVSSWNM